MITRVLKRCCIETLGAVLAVNIAIAFLGMRLQDRINGDSTPSLEVFLGGNGAG